MSPFLDALRGDLLDRRLRPLLALLGLALLGAIVYAVLAGSGSSAPTSVAGAGSSAATRGVVVSAVKNETTQALAETASGASKQTGGATRNPFTPLPTPKAKVAATAPSSSPSSSSSSSSSSASGSGSSASAGSGSSGSGSASEPSSSSGTGGSSPSKPKSAPKKPQTVYAVSVLFGAAAPGTPLASTQLTPYEPLQLQQPLPSAQQALIVFRGVVAGAKSATFTLVGEAILRGTAVCRPSTTQCQSIDLQVGQTEELEYAPPGATATNYMLHVVSITGVKASAKGARRVLGGESKAGLQVLRAAGLQALPGLRFSRAKGVLVFAGHGAFAARAHAANSRARAVAG